MDARQEKNLLACNVDILIDIFKKEENKTIFSKIIFSHKDNTYTFYLNTNKEIKSYIVFEKKIQVKLITKGELENIITFDIRTNIDLLNFLKQTELDINRIIISNSNKIKLKQCIDIINIYVKNFSLDLEIIERKIPAFKFETVCLDMEKVS